MTKVAVGPDAVAVAGPDLVFIALAVALVAAATIGFLVLYLLGRLDSPITLLPGEWSPPGKGRRSLVLSRVEAMLARACLLVEPRTFITLTALSILAVGAVVGLWVHWALGLAAMLLALLLLRLYLLRRIHQRGQFVAGELPRFLRLLRGCLHSGFSLMQAFDMAVREGPPLLAAELQRVTHEVNVGAPLEVALDRMAARLRNDDIDLFVSAVVISREVGGNLGETLGTLAETVRERARLRKQVQVLTAQARLSGLILSLLPIGLTVVMALLNPDYTLTLFRHPLGWLLLGVAAVSQAVGIWIIRRIVQRGGDLLT